MAFPIAAALAAIPWTSLVPIAVRLAEKVLPGPKRGEEKKPLAAQIISGVADALPEVFAALPSNGAVESEIEKAVGTMNSGAESMAQVADLLGAVAGDRPVLSVHIDLTVGQLADLVSRVLRRV